MRIVREISDWAAQIVILIFATSTVAMPYVIPSGSMENTLMTGDHVIVDRLAYAPGNTRLLPYSEVKPGDIVVFRYPVDIKQNFVKRVIGIPGDRLHIENGVVTRNGQLLHEPYVHRIPALQRPESLDIAVPPDNYFMMGDNRDNSLDSRSWGFVPRENITGKPVVIFWSYDAPEEDLLDYNAHHLIDLAQHFFTKTRWERTFRLVRAD